MKVSFNKETAMIQVTAENAGESQQLYQMAMGVTAPLTCCTKDFKNTAALKMHRQRVHEGMAPPTRRGHTNKKRPYAKGKGKENYECCGSVFTWRESYRKHRREKHGERRHSVWKGRHKKPCPVAECGFTGVNVMQHMVRKHPGTERPSTNGELAKTKHLPIESQSQGYNRVPIGV